MKKFYLLFVVSVLFVSLGFSQDDDCIVSAGFELTPPPVDDPENTGFATYATETTVQICYTVEEYNTPGTQNWMHGIVPSFGPGWNMSTLQPVGQPEAQTNFGEWIWVEDGVTAGITGEFIPLAGWWYDSTQGTVPAGTPLDGDPSNNWGDGNNGPWTFCWEITTQSSPPQLDGASLIVEILNFADSETGSWNNAVALDQCIDDPSFFIQGLVLDAPTCDESEIVVVNPTCENINTTGGVAIISPVGVGPWDYIWFNLDNGEIIQENSNIDFPGVVTVSGLDPGEYLIQVQDLGFAGGCASGEAFQILPPESISVEFDIDSVTCLESSDGSIILSSIMNENCIDEASIPQVIDFTLCPSTPDPVCGCNFVTYNNDCYATTFYGITSYDAGACPETNPDYTISWSSDNSISGSGTEVNNLVAGDYTVFIECVDNTSPVFGCSFESVVTVPSPDPWNISGDFDDDDYNGYQVSCNGANDGAISDITVISGGNGGYTYAWTGPSGFFSTEMNPSSLIAGNYELTVTDQYGCISEPPIEFIASQPALLDATFTTSDYSGFEISCNGGSDGAIDLNITGGVPPYTFDWSDGSSDQNLSNASAGTYSVTISCANNCQLVLNNLVLTEPDVIEVTNSTEQAVLCFGFEDGLIGVTVEGGVGPYEYVWTNEDEDIISTAEDLVDIPSGSYTLDITDQNNCVYQEIFNIPTPSPIVIFDNIDHISCFGENDGSIDITVEGGTPFSAGVDAYNYTWSITNTSQDISNLEPGSYDIIVTDSQGCTQTETYTINEPSILVIDEVELNHIDCNGEATGSAIPSVEGGTGIYTYLWSNGDETENLIDVVADTYTLTVQDANGCVDFISVILNEPLSAMDVTPVVTDVVCYGEDNGSVELDITGGTPPYDIDDLESTYIAGDDYSVTVTDANDCEEVVYFDIDQPNEIVLDFQDQNGNSIDVDDLEVTCYGASDGFVQVSPSGGTGSSYTYLWNTGSTELFINDLSPGTYFVSVTDQEDCQAYQDFTIGEPASNELQIIAPEIISCLDDFDISIVSESSGNFSGDWTSSNSSVISFSDDSSDESDNTTTVIFDDDADYGEYSIQFEDDNCGEIITFNFEMLSVPFNIDAEPHAWYCEDSETTLDAQTDSDGYWTIVSPSEDELEENNTDISFNGGWFSNNPTVTIEALDDSEECCYGEYIFSFVSCGTEEFVTVYYGKRAPKIGTSTHQECVLDGNIYIDNPISFSDALLDPGFWTAVGSNADQIDILYETPHEVGVHADEYGMYTLEYNNCDTTFRQKIGFSCPLTLPNVFTPNGDGNNDTFTSDQLKKGIHDQVNFTVYNRFGTIIHAQSGWSPVDGTVLWDGTTNTFQDRSLNDGVYFYTLELFNKASNRKEMYNGYVHVFGGDN